VNAPHTPLQDTMNATAAGPLAGLKVLELGQLIAGPLPPRPWLTLAPTWSRSTTRRG
jgi:hypothetical protein